MCKNYWPEIQNNLMMSISQLFIIMVLMGTSLCCCKLVAASLMVNFVVDADL